MKTKTLVVFVLGIASFVIIESGRFMVNAAPPRRGDGSPNIESCLEFRCDSPTGPVCGIDSSGIPRTFENRCLADLAYCREGRYYAVVKDGEC